MLFNSITFVVFFVVVVALYWSMSGWNARKNLLVVASYIFYGAWNPPFAALLFSTTAMDFWLGRQIARAQDRPAKKRWLVASVCMNLSMLGFFKYGNFLLQNFQWLVARIGIIYQPPHLDILLPVGISFYTFHSLSYTLDIYRGVLQPTRSLRDFILAVSFFPQLVAGPIVRAGDFLPQLVRPPRLRIGQFMWGLLLMTLGLFEKIVLADTMLAGSADRIFGYAGPLVALDSWLGVIAFVGQIFFDFAGYSTCVIEHTSRALIGERAWTANFAVKLLLGLITYGAVCLAWVFFRASDFTIATRMLRGMFGGHPHGDAILATREILQIGIVTFFMMLAHWSLRDINVETAVTRLPRWVVTSAWALMACAIILTQGTSNAFIYFQF